MKETKHFIDSLLTQPNLPLPLVQMDNLDVSAVLQTICALLNADGGWIVVKMKDGQQPDGMEETFLQKEVITHIMPLPVVYIQSETYDHYQLLLITVMKGKLSPYTYKGQYFMLAGREVCKPNSNQMGQMLRDKLPVRSGWEGDSCLMAEDEDLDESLLDEIYHLALKKDRIRESENGLKKTLSDIQLLTVSKITNGAVALFARDTRSLLPQCRIRIQFMLSGKTADQYNDIQIIEGNLFSALDQAFSYFKERLPKIALFNKQSMLRSDDFLYPMDVIDEALTNAVIHRDYTDRMGEIVVNIYTNHIEIINSGELPEKIVSGKNKVLPHSSILRNPLMAEVFFLAGRMEKTGRGMALIHDTMKENGYRLPEWISKNGQTKLIIYSIKDDRELNVRIQDFLRTRMSGTIFSKSEYMHAFEKEISKGTAQNDISLMLEKRICEKIGNGVSTRYRML